MTKTGNQQVTLRDLGWLSGIIDGDGTIVFTEYIRKNGKVCYMPAIRLTNSSMEIIEKFVRILDALEVSCTVSKPTMKGRLGTKPVVTVSLQRIPAIKKFLDIVVDDLSMKQARGKLMLRYCNLRLKHGLKSPYGDGEAMLAHYWKENLRIR